MNNHPGVSLFLVDGNRQQRLAEQWSPKAFYDLDMAREYMAEVESFGGHPRLDVLGPGHPDIDKMYAAGLVLPPRMYLR